MCQPSFMRDPQLPQPSQADIVGDLSVDAQPLQADNVDNSAKDNWIIAGSVQVRQHATPRKKERAFCVPTEEESPIPVKFICVTRRTYTDMDHVRENVIRDVWGGMVMVKENSLRGGRDAQGLVYSDSHHQMANSESVI